MLSTKANEGDVRRQLLQPEEQAEAGNTGATAVENAASDNPQPAAASATNQVSGDDPSLSSEAPYVPLRPSSDPADVSEGTTHRSLAAASGSGVVEREPVRRVVVPAGDSSGEESEPEEGMLALTRRPRRSSVDFDAIRDYPWMSGIYRKKWPKYLSKGEWSGHLLVNSAGVAIGFMGNLPAVPFVQLCVQQLADIYPGLPKEEFEWAAIVMFLIANSFISRASIAKLMRWVLKVTEDMQHIKHNSAMTRSGKLAYGSLTLLPILASAGLSAGIVGYSLDVMNSGGKVQPSLVFLDTMEKVQAWHYVADTAGFFQMMRAIHEMRTPLREFAGWILRLVKLCCGSERLPSQLLVGKQEVDSLRVYMLQVFEGYLACFPDIPDRNKLHPSARPYVARNRNNNITGHWAGRFILEVLGIGCVINYCLLTYFQAARTRFADNAWAYFWGIVSAIFNTLVLANSWHTTVTKIGDRVIATSQGRAPVFGGALDATMGVFIFFGFIVGATSLSGGVGRLLKYAPFLQFLNAVLLSAPASGCINTADTVAALLAGLEAWREFYSSRKNRANTQGDVPKEHLKETIVQFATQEPDVVRRWIAELSDADLMKVKGADGQDVAVIKFRIGGHNRPIYEDGYHYTNEDGQKSSFGTHSFKIRQSSAGVFPHCNTDNGYDYKVRTNGGIFCDFVNFFQNLTKKEKHLQASLKPATPEDQSPELGPVVTNTPSSPSPAVASAAAGVWGAAAAGRPMKSAAARPLLLDPETEHKM